MSDDGYRKIVIGELITEETRKENEKLGHLNYLDAICHIKNLTADEFTEVYEETLRSIMRLCESRLKNSFSRKKRYEDEIAKESYAVCADESDPD